MTGFTRRALIGAAAGAGLSVVGIGGLLALCGAGGDTLTATAVLASKRIRNLFPNAVYTRWNTHLWWAEDGR